DGVEQVRESKYIMLHAPRAALPRIRELLPGSEFPTIIPLEGSVDKVAVHAQHGDRRDGVDFPSRWSAWRRELFR
ncbi:MAG: hypothetical protein EBU32_13790, partial [Opitutaceae bacterium]|nr:hypothetical protein [Opitutaceae bacterium]